MRLFISKKRWHEIFLVLARRRRRRRRRQICLFGTRVDGRYTVLWAADARGIRTAGRVLARGRCIGHGKSSRNSKSHFLGVLFVHPPGKYWLTWGELRRIRKLLDSHMELVSGVLVAFDHSVALYPVHFSKIGLIGTDMYMEDDGGFICSQSRSALDLLLRRGPG
jgi:hypothetical protein